ncbi:hypothetical protein ACM9XD_04900 [Xanthomonas sacchari]
MNAQVISPDIDISRPLCLMELTKATERAEHIVDGIAWARLHRMRTRMHDALHDHEQDGFVGTIRELYQSLPAERQARVLLSSEFCECYLAMDAARKRQHELGARSFEATQEIGRAMASLHGLVSRECAIAHLASGAPNAYLRECRQWTVYSPLGDCFAERDVHGHWSVHEVTKVGGCIAIDLDSPSARHHEPRSGVLSQACLPLSAQERDDVIAKITRALELIDRAEPLYGMIIRNFVRRIVVRKSQERTDTGPRHYGSEHVPRQPGSLRLLNIHQHELSVEACMESIMHESTHNFLAAWELANGFFVANDYNYRVVSPWSGNQIPNSSFIHAVFVYYICHRLLKRHLEMESCTDKSARSHIHKRLAVCAAGFLIEQPLSENIMSSKRLNRDIAAMIDTLQIDMKREYAYRGRR